MILAEEEIPYNCSSFEMLDTFEGNNFLIKKLWKFLIN